MLLAAVAWDGGGDGTKWSDPLNWSSDATPAAGDDVTIAFPSTTIIRLNSDDPAVSLNSLNCSARLRVTGSLNIAATAHLSGPVDLWGGTFSGGTWNLSDATGMSVSVTSTVDGAIFQGDIYLKATGGVLRVLGGASFDRVHLQAQSTSIDFAPGSVLTGDILMDDPAWGSHYVGMMAPGTLTIAPSGSIVSPLPLVSGVPREFHVGTQRGLTPAMNLINNGLMSSGMQLGYIDATTLENNGTIAVQNSGARLEVRNSWSSQNGVFQVGNGAALIFAGNFTTAGIGTIQNAGSGKVEISGILDNTGANLEINQATGSIRLEGTINGGTVSFANGKQLIPSRATLRDVTVLGILQLPTSTGVNVFGTTRFQGAALSGGGLTFENGGVLNDPVTISGLGGSIQAQAGGVLTISPTGSITGLTGANSGGLGGDGTVINNGTITWAGQADGFGLTISKLINNGSIIANLSKIRLAGSTTNNGVITANASGTIEVKTDLAAAVGSRIDGTGRVDFIFGQSTFTTGTFALTGALTVYGSNSVVNFNGTLSQCSIELAWGGVANFNASQDLTGPLFMSGGTFGGTGNIRLTGAVKFTWGSMLGSGVTTIAASATVALGDGGEKYFGRRIDNLGTVNMLAAPTAGCQFISLAGGVFNNLPGANFNVTHGVFRGVASAPFNNSGTFSVLSGDNTDFETMPFNNNGLVKLAGARLGIGGGGTNTQPIEIPSTGWLRFMGSYNYSGASSIYGAGVLQILQGTHDFKTNGLAVSGTIYVDSPASVTVSTGFTVATLGLNGTFIGNAPITIASLSLSNGTLTGSGDITVTTQLSWDRGTMQGTGRTILGSGATGTISPAGGRLARRLDNSGNLTTSSTNFRLGVAGQGPATINNLAAGTFVLTGGADCIADVAGAHVLNNQGQLRVAFGTSTFSGITVNNSGAIVVPSGTLELLGGGSVGATGSVSNSSIIAFAGVWIFSAGSTIGGEGGFRFDAGQFDVRAPLNTTGTLTINNGGSLLAAASLDAGALAMNGVSVLRLAAPSNSILKITSLTMSANALLDLGRNGLIIQYAGAAPTASLRLAIQRAYAGGGWTGYGVSSTSVEAGKVGIGYAEASQLGLTSFLGRSLTGPSLVARAARFGDANLDDIVDATDLTTLSLNWQGTGKVFSQADFNYDGNTGIDDLYLLASNWQQTLPPPLPAISTLQDLISRAPAKRIATRVLSI